jgi:hypothetical protein
VTPSGKRTTWQIFGATKRLTARMNDTDSHDVGHSVKILHSFTSACAPNEIVESFRLGGMSLLMEERTRINRCFVTPETARRVLDIFPDPPLRFYISYLDENDKNEVEDGVKETKEEKENVQMILQEIRGAIGA